MCTIEYDRYGRMKYNPEFHPNNGKLWNDEDLEYLKTWYDQIGIEEMSYALGRTMGTVYNMVSRLRKEGIMKYPEVQMRTSREAFSSYKMEAMG